MDRKHLTRLFIVVAIVGAAGTIFTSLMPDFLYNRLAVSGEMRGMLEFPREMPGFFMVLLLGMAAALPKARALAYAIMVGIAALLGIAWLSHKLLVFVVFMVLWSAAVHVFFPLRDALAIELAGSRQRGWILGRIGAYRSLGLISGTGLVILCMQGLRRGFAFTYTTGAVILVAALWLALALPTVPGDRQAGTPMALGRRFVFRKRYRMYYLLAILFGARKQIFITFAPWLLVSRFSQQAPQLAFAMGVAAAIGLFAKPLFGRLIDRFGERAVLSGDAVVLFFLCIGYAAIPLWCPAVVALPLLYALFVADELLFSLSMARTTYLSRILKHRSDMVPTIGLGGSLDHLVSMVIPIGAGIMWQTVGYWSVFSLAALLAVITLVVVRFLPSHSPDSAPTA